MNVSRNRISVDHSGSVVPASGERPRQARPNLVRAKRRIDVDTLIAISDLLDKEPTIESAFESLVEIVRPLIAFDMLVVAPSKVGRAALVSGALALRSTAMAIVESASRYFAGEAPFDEYAALASASLSEKWITLPLSNDGDRVVGVMVVASPSSVQIGESALALLSWVARQLAGKEAAGHRGDFGAVVKQGHEPASSPAAGAEDARLRERDQMLSTVSHDLKNPLGVILMSATYLLEAMPANERRRAGRTQIEAIYRNARRMKRLVTDLLDCDAIDAGRMAMMPTVVHPRMLVDAAIEDTMHFADAAGVVLRRGALSKLPLVWADTERVVQVLLNLLTNAVKFTTRGGRITVRARRSSEKVVTFAVEDSGIGIGPEDLSHVFERHWQAASTGKAALGSGLGLAICKSLIELSNGHIWATSRPGHGTTMMFTLPVSSVRKSGAVA